MCLNNVVLALKNLHDWIPIEGKWENKMKKIREYFQKLTSVISILSNIGIGLLLAILITFIFNIEIKYPVIKLIMLAISLFALLSFSIYIYKARGSIKSMAPSKIDGILIILIISLFSLCVVQSNFFVNIWFTNKIIHTITGSIAIILIGLYATKINCYKTPESENTKHLSLRNLVNNNIPDNIKDFVLVDEICNFDLLNRSIFINELKECAFDLKSDTTRIVALTGKWGAGKTSLLTNAINAYEKENQCKINDKFYIIKDFDCWDYDDARSLFVGIIKTIYNELHLGDLNHSAIKDIETLANSFLADAPINFNLESLLSSSENQDKIFNLINEHLKVSDKQLVFMLDNLDRMSMNNIVFAYKIIATKLKFCNTTFICMYDEKIVNKALEECGLLPEYLDKILNYKISIPDVNNKYLNQLANKCINTFIEKYYKIDLDSKYYIDKQQIYNSIKFITNPRDLIRFFNFLATKLSKSKNANISDLITLNVIKTVNFDLYNLIFNCKDILIVKNYYNDGKNGPTSITKTNLINLFDSNQKKNYSIYLLLLDYLFPSFVQNELDYSGTNVTSKELSKRPIESSCYFDLYFIENSCDFVPLDKEQKAKIKKIKELSNDELISLLLKEVSYLNKGYITEIYGEYIEHLGLSKFLIEKIVSYSKNEPDDEKRKLYFKLASDLISKISKSELNIIKRKWSNNPKYFAFCNRCYNITSNSFFFSVENNLKKKIFDSTINLFSQTNYFPNMIETIINTTSSLEIRKYFTNLVTVINSSDNLRFLYDLSNYCQSHPYTNLIRNIDYSLLKSFILKCKPRKKEDKDMIINLKQLLNI